ncbi:MAG: molybdopterin molybdotransferase MoeA [Fibrobacteria bacterium]
MDPDFREMLSPADADALLAAAMPRYAPVTLPLSKCQGRILRAPILADRAQPPFDRVAMDGIAFAFASWEQGLRRFRLEGMQKAGEPAKLLKRADGCLEAMTGAVLPQGADCIMPVEEIRIEDGHAVLSEQAPDAVPFRFVHRAGLDCAAGETLVPAGTFLDAARLGAAAAFGYAELRVAPEPFVAVVSTGDELVDVGRDPRPHQIRKSNPYAVEAALRKRRFERVALLHSRDDAARLRKCLEGVMGKCEVLILTGGVSMGKTDYVPGVLRELGVRPVFHKILQKPGKPFWFGVGAGGTPVFGLPGNPASVLVCLHRYVLPALTLAMGAETIEGSIARAWSPAALSQGAAASGKLTHFRPVTCGWDAEGRMRAEWVANQGSGDFSGWSKADGFVELGAGDAPWEAGRVVPLWRW